MSDEPQDVQDITAICGGLNINIGTLNVRTIEGMLAAGHKANELNHMVPVSYTHLDVYKRQV